jgi:hypothetical protein
MRKLTIAALGTFLLAALVSRVAEQAGVARCECASDCWCRRPGLSLFRWVFPRGHRGVYTPEEKARLEAAGD